MPEPKRWDGLRPVLVALVLDTAVLIADIVEGSGAAFVGLLAIGPLVAAAFTTPLRTAAAGAIAIATGALAVTLDGDLTSARDVVRLAGLAVATYIAVIVSDRRTANERKIGTLRRVADSLQEAVLRPVPSSIGPVRCAARYLSASTETRVGGDFHEVVETPWGVRAIVGDVRGKGIEAIRLAASLLGSFREAALSHHNLADVAAEMDQVVVDLGGPEDFATAVLVEVGEDEVAVVNCGHHPPLRVNDGAVEPLKGESGLPLGLGGAPAAGRFPFEVRDRVLLYTDGVVEARNARGDFFDVRAAAKASRALAVDDALDSIVDAVRTHATDHVINDDVALLLLERVKPSPPSVFRSWPRRLGAPASSRSRLP